MRNNAAAILVQTLESYEQPFPQTCTTLSNAKTFESDTRSIALVKQHHNSIHDSSPMLQQMAKSKKISVLQPTMIRLGDSESETSTYICKSRQPALCAPQYKINQSYCKALLSKQLTPHEKGSPSHIIVDLDLSQDEEETMPAEKVEESNTDVAEENERCDPKTFECETFQRQLKSHEVGSSSPHAPVDPVDQQMQREM